MTVGNIASKYSSRLQEINFEKLTLDSPFTYSFVSDLKSIRCLVFHSLNALEMKDLLSLEVFWNLEIILQLLNF